MAQAGQVLDEVILVSRLPAFEEGLFEPVANSAEHCEALPSDTSQWNLKCLLARVPSLVDIAPRIEGCLVKVDDGLVSFQELLQPNGELCARC